MNIAMISPGFPLEQAYFTRALAQTGARVIGVGDQPLEALPPEARENLAHYEHVALADEGAVLRALSGLAEHARIDQVECLWEPYVVLAARIREHLGIAGMSVEQANWFRDKEQMKLVLDRAGIRTPRHASAGNAAEIWEAAEQIGYPLIIKPIAGAGSADTYRVDNAEELATVQTMIGHVGQMSVEEFIDGEEFTYDTVCGNRPCPRAFAPARSRPGCSAPPPAPRWPAPAPTAQPRVDQPGDTRPLGPVRSTPGRRHRDGPSRHRGTGLHPRLHSHGVVSQVRRRGRLR